MRQDHRREWDKLIKLVRARPVEIDRQTPVFPYLISPQINKSKFQFERDWWTENNVTDARPYYKVNIIFINMTCAQCKFFFVYYNKLLHLLRGVRSSTIYQYHRNKTRRIEFWKLFRTLRARVLSF